MDTVELAIMVSDTVTEFTTTVDFTEGECTVKTIVKTNSSTEMIVESSVP